MSDTYSTDGPVCPYCKYQHRADEPFFYDENLEEMDCDGCGFAFGVTVFTRTSWTCEGIE